MQNNDGDLIPGYRCIGGPNHNEIIATDSTRYVATYGANHPMTIQIDSVDSFSGLKVGTYELRTSHWTSERALVWCDDAAYYTEFCDYSYLK